MTPFVQDRDFTLYQGDALEVLRGLPDESVDCVATSPPFYGLRDYGVDGQIGLEGSLDEWVARLVAIFGECRRVLSPTGTLWVECGDSYFGAPKGNLNGQDKSGLTSVRSQLASPPGIVRECGVKPKDLIGQPWELAFALRANGWWLRQALVWHKPNAMPESAKDRCTTAHSYVFMLSKRARYFFDAAAIAEPAEWARWGDQTVPKHEGTDTAAGWIKPRTKQDLTAAARVGDRGDTYSGFNERWKATGRRTNGDRKRTDEMRGFDNRLERADGLKNARSVWTIPTRGFPDAHFATWPEALAERIIRAGCPKDGVILDPFMGSGTTALVARRLGRRSVGIELNPSYCEMAAHRLSQQSLLAEAGT